VHIANMSCGRSSWRLLRRDDPGGAWQRSWLPRDWPSRCAWSGSWAIAWRFYNRHARVTRCMRNSASPMWARYRCTSRRLELGQCVRSGQWVSGLGSVGSQVWGQCANSFSHSASFPAIIGRAFSATFLDALPIRSSQRVAHLRCAPHFQPRRQPSARGRWSFSRLASQASPLDRRRAANSIVPHPGVLIPSMSCARSSSLIDHSCTLTLVFPKLTQIPPANIIRRRGVR
jgi:hypothetical protein